MQNPGDPSGGPPDERQAAPKARSASRSQASFAWPRPGIVAAVGAGGVVGACLRYEVAQALPTGPAAFPGSTLLINVTGSFVLGALLTVLLERWRPSEYVRPLIASGLIGAYTTWSTFVVEADQLFQHGHLSVGLAYLAASLCGGLLAAWVGVLAGRLEPRAVLPGGLITKRREHTTASHGGRTTPSRAPSKPEQP